MGQEGFYSEEATNMTRVTSNIGAIFGDIIVSTVDALAVGRGTGAEASGADALADEVHRASVDSSTVELIQPGSNSDSELAIEVGGGTEVTGGTEITEVGAFIGQNLIIIDEFAPVTVEAGHRQEFVIPVDSRVVN